MPDSPQTQYFNYLVKITGKEFSVEATDTYYAWSDARTGRFDTSWDELGHQLKAQSDRFVEILRGEDGKVRAADFQRFQDAMQKKSGYRTRFCFVDGVPLMGPVSETP